MLFIACRIEKKTKKNDVKVFSGSLECLSTVTKVEKVPKHAYYLLSTLIDLLHYVFLGSINGMRWAPEAVFEVGVGGHTHVSHNVILTPMATRPQEDGTLFLSERFPITDSPWGGGRSIVYTSPQ